MVIEDDYDGEFRYDRQPVGAVQALAPEHVVYAGTASKSLAPGLRLGWLVLPAPLVDDVVAAKTLADRQTSALDQLTLAEFIAAGGYDRHVRRSRLGLPAAPGPAGRGVGPRHARRGASPASRPACTPWWTCRAASTRTRSSPAPPGTAWPSRGSALQRVRRGGPRHGPALVVGYGTPPEHAFTGAVARLCAVLDGPAGST